MHTARRLFFASALALAFVGGPVFAGEASQTGQPETAAASAALSSIDIDNFGRVNADYYRGAQPEAGDYADLKALGIKLVIDLQKDGDPAEETQVTEAGMSFARIPMTTHEPPTAERLEQFLSLVKDPANQPVYVHCAGGRHRTGVMTAAYRMAHEGWTAEKAFGEMKKYKFGADFLHPEFKQFVYAYHPAARPAVAVAAQQ